MRTFLLLAFAPALAACNPQASPTGAGAAAPSGSEGAPEIAAAADAAPAAAAVAAEVAPDDATLVTPTTDDQKAIYALGVSAGRQLAPFNLTPEELRLYEAGVSASVLGMQPAIDADTYLPSVQQLARTRMRAAAQSYLDRAAQEAGAVKTESGLVYKSLQDGSGASPKATDIVNVRYRGTTITGHEVDAQSGSLPLGETMRCWNEGVQMMKVGGKARLVCPPQLAYGERGAPPKIPGDATLIFEIELLGIGD